MIDIALLLLGAAGALITVYLVKQTPIPEFRPLFDTTQSEVDAAALRDHIQKTKKEIDDLQDRLRQELISADLAPRLKEVIDTSQRGLELEQAELKGLERQIRQSQIFSRGVGFLVYIVLGGVLGALLAGRVKVEGLAGDLPVYFQSLLIGATWTTYLSAIGFRTDQQRIDARLEAVKTETSTQLAMLKEKLTTPGEDKTAVRETPLTADQALAVAKSMDETNNALTKHIDETNRIIQGKLDLTRQLIR